MSEMGSAARPGGMGSESEEEEQRNASSGSISELLGDAFDGSVFNGDGEGPLTVKGLPTTGAELESALGPIGGPAPAPDAA